MMKSRRFLFPGLAIALILPLSAFVAWKPRRPLYDTLMLGRPFVLFATPAPMIQTNEADVTPIPAPRTIGAVVQAVGPKVEKRFAPLCKKAGIPYPPPRVQLLAFKEEKRLEIWGADRTGPFRFLAAYPVQAASGNAGPKQREGDYQVPEGFYDIDVLNPQSRFHLSMRVAYPNAEDIAHAVVPREEMGGEIYIHGNHVSIGCLAMGDSAIEEIFGFVAQTEPRERHILIVPRDLRRQPAPETDDKRMRDLYQRLESRLKADFAG